jgi:hypothetical protein
MSFMVAATARAAEHENSKSKGRQHAQQLESTTKARVILCDVTGSRIPQRVTVGGQQVNSASPLVVYASPDLLRGGSSSVAGILALDPSISFGTRTGRR